jgi:GNAT superfamily N-acetyltransferase
MGEVRIRTARPDDVGAVHALVHELAGYEREPDAVEARPADLAAALFGPDPRVHCHVAEVVDDDGLPAVVGMAVWFVSFSTWRGRHGIWLEDLFVRPEHRGAGIGRALLATLAAECAARGWTRLEWAVLDWNTPAHGFYRSLGAAPQDEWTTWRLDGERLAALGTR